MEGVVNIRNIFKKVLIIFSFIFATFILFGFKSNSNTQEISFNLLKQELESNERVIRLTDSEVNNLSNFTDIFYIDEDGALDKFSPEVKYDKQNHVVFRFELLDDDKQENEKNSLHFKSLNSRNKTNPYDEFKKNGISDSEYYIQKRYNYKGAYKKIERKENFDIKNYNKKNVQLTSTNNTLDLHNDLYKIGSHHNLGSSYGGCGPAAEYIALQYLISSNGLDLLLRNRIVKDRNISYLNKNYANNVEYKAKFADYIYANTPTKNHSEDETSTNAFQMVRGINNTFNGMKLDNIFSGYKTNAFQKRFKRIKDDVKNGIPTLVWTWKRNMYEDSHWFVVYGYETWKLTPKKGKREKEVTLFKICDRPNKNINENSSDKKLSYVDGAYLKGIWGSVQLRVRKHKYFNGSNFNLIKNRYYNYHAWETMKNQFYETQKIGFTRMGYINSLDQNGSIDGMFNTLSAGRNNINKAKFEIIDNNGIKGIYFNIALWGEYERFNPETDYIRITSGTQNKECFRFSFNNISKNRYDKDLFSLWFKRKTTKVTIEVYKKEIYNSWNLGRVVIDDVITHE